MEREYTQGKEPLSLSLKSLLQPWSYYMTLSHWPEFTGPGVDSWPKIGQSDSLLGIWMWNTSYMTGSVGEGRWFSPRAGAVIGQVQRQEKASLQKQDEGADTQTEMKVRNCAVSETKVSVLGPNGFPGRFQPLVKPSWKFWPSDLWLLILPINYFSWFKFVWVCFCASQPRSSILRRKILVTRMVTVFVCMCVRGLGLFIYFWSYWGLNPGPCAC